MIGRAALAASALAAALAGCGGDREVLVPVTFSLDAESCSTDVADDVGFDCETAVGLWLRPTEDSEPVARACLDLPADAYLSDLPAVLSQASDDGVLDLSGLGDQSAVLSVAVYSPRRAADGCPDPADFVDDMLVYGQSEEVDLADASRGLLVNLFCTGLPVDVIHCQGACDAKYYTCTRDIGIDACDAESDTCYDMCAETDEACFTDCDDAWTACYDQANGPACDADLDDCSAGCTAGDTTCTMDCMTARDECVSYGYCESRDDVCYAACDQVDAGSECVTLF